MSLSDDGNRGYIADSHGGQMMVLDTSQIQARLPSPVVREVSRLTWKSVSIPQNAIPFTENGHPYILEFDEYTAGIGQPGTTSADEVGAARIIDMADETKPRVIANMITTVRSPPTIRARSAPSRATRLTTATSPAASIPRSWPARSSPPACGC